MREINYKLYTHDVTGNLNRWNSTDNDIYKKDQGKLKNFEIRDFLKINFTLLFIFCYYVCLY